MRSYSVVQVLRKTLYLAVPVVIVFAIVSWFSFAEIRKQNTLAVRNSVGIYQAETAHRLGAIQHFVQWTVVHDPILDSFDTDKHMGDFRKASDELRLRVSDMQYSTGSEYQYFFYWDEGDIFFNASALNLDYETYKEIREKITKDVASDSIRSSWKPYEFKEKSYMGYGITYDHRTFVALVSLDDLLSPLATMTLGEYGGIDVEEPSLSPRLFYDRLYFPGDEVSLPFSIYIDTEIIGNFGRLFVLMFFVFLAALMLTFIMGGYVLVSYKKVILPIKIFSKGLSEMSSVDEGEGIVLTDSKVQELNQINDQFKNLIHEITRLRIDIYEAELDKNRFMVHFLQQQIKPHFYLNCLTTIDSMVSLGDITAAQNMLKFTSKYFRYLFQVDMNFVPLINELDHIEDYLTIQNLRLGQVIEYTKSVPKALYQRDVPPLLLITFVENSLKHAKPKGGENLKIWIDCAEGAGDKTKIVIRDNGQGFSPKILDKIQNRESITEMGNHVGITNCIRRLELLYGDAFDFAADNLKEGGARITLRL